MRLAFDTGARPPSLLVELVAGASEARRDRPWRNAEQLGGLGHRELLELAQDEHGAEIEVHRVEHCVEQRPRTHPVELGVLERSGIDELRRILPEHLAAPG